MTESFFGNPILNSPYAPPERHWELDNRQPTNAIMPLRRRSDLITPVPKPKKQKKSTAQSSLEFGLAEQLSSADQEYNPTPLINEIRGYVENWRKLPNPDQWQVTPETDRLLNHWRSYPFEGVLPFFCQVEAVETAIWLTEVAPKMGARGAKFWKHLEGANRHANPELIRILEEGGQIRVKIEGLDVFKPQTGEVISEGPDGIALWMIDTDYNEEGFFVRHAYFLGANEPYKALKTTLKVDIDQKAWESLNSYVSRPFDEPKSGRIAVKVINHLGNEVMKVVEVP